jgi:signal-transduction protein with cAMP-binding, CBS, and nucleotidyltransferase domain
MIKEVPRAEWATTTAGQAMLPIRDVKRVPPDPELWDALEEMDRDGVNHLPVMSDGSCMGMLSRENLIGYYAPSGGLVNRVYADGGWPARSKDS